MKTLTFILFAGLSLGLGAAEKIAYINSQVLLEQSPQAIAANAKLREQFGEREKKLRKLAIEIKDMEKTYKNDGAIMSAEQKQKAEENIIQKKRRFQFEQQSLKEDLQTKQRELLQQIQVAIKSVIRDFGNRHGYDFIFTDAGIAFGSNAVNITDEILQELKK